MCQTQMKMEVTLVYTGEENKYMHSFIAMQGEVMLIWTLPSSPKSRPYSNTLLSDNLIKIFTFGAPRFIVVYMRTSHTLSLCLS